MLLAPQAGPPGTTMDTKPSYLRIRQTASTINARLLFEDGESKATTTVLGEDRYGDDLLLLFYDFEPRQPSDEQPRKGATSLRITKGALTGGYWNNIGVRGNLTSSGHARRTYETFDAATLGTYSQR